MNELVKSDASTSPAVSICIVKGYAPITETFILAHAEHLPAQVTVVHDKPPKIGDQPIYSQSASERLASKAWRILGRRANIQQVTAAYIKVLRQIRAAAVLAEYGPSGVAVLEACRLTRIPLIVHFHGFDASKHATLEEHARTYPVMFREAAAIIAVSHSMRKKLIALGAPPEKVHYNPYGVDYHAFAGADPAKAPPVFVAAGRFVDKKAPHLTLLAFAAVHRSHKEARLRMIGDGPLLAACQDLAKAYGIDSAVTFLGAQSHSVVQAEMQRARCFVQHSVEAASGDCEGTPVSILEAGASGLPVISTRHAGIPDVIIEEQTGLLSDEHDVDGMAEHMRRLIREPETASAFGLAARERTRNHFSMELSVQRLWSIIESTFDRR